MNIDSTRKIVLDTETTGMNKVGTHYLGHRIIEIGAVEIVNRCLTGRYFHVYLKPNRNIDPEAFNIHGISNKFLEDKPQFSDISGQFLKFIHGSELIIHNASFDIGFIDYECMMLNCGISKIHTICKITDSLLIARKIFPGKRNSLDALCDRYSINIQNRMYHSALFDAKILANIFLLMTSDQMTMNLVINTESNKHNILYQDINSNQNLYIQHPLKIVYANSEEIMNHEKKLDLIQKESGKCIWRE